MSSHHNSTALAAAEECLRKAVAVDPTYYEALLMLAELIITSTYLRLVDNSANRATAQTVCDYSADTLAVCRVLCRAVYHVCV